MAQRVILTGSHVAYIHAYWDSFFADRFYYDLM